jgi:glycosyltransferase involved in cell wall biosynthesis
MKNPLVSVIVPIYNVEKYLEQCLLSIVNQTYYNLEIILVNDGSTDNSFKIIDNFKEKDQRIKVFNQINQGNSAARNTGLNSALGDFIMFVDSDDWIAESICSQLVDTIIEYNADVVLTSFNYEYEYKSIPSKLFKSKLVFEKSDYIKFYRKILGPTKKELSKPADLDKLSTVWGKLYKSTLIKNNKVQFEDIKLIGAGEDLLFNLEVLINAKTAICLPNSLYHYRKINLTSFTKHFKPNLFNKWSEALFQKIRALTENDNELKIAFNNRIILSIIQLGLNEIRNPKGYSDRIKNIKQILNDPLYRTAYKQLELKYFPLHWKLFFAFAKYKIVVGVYVMLLGIKYFVNRNN